MLSDEPSGVTVRTRFAPSPTGRLHLGHALAARVAHDLAREHGGQFLLRHEDIDVSRVREEYFEQIEDDLCWLGLRWDGPALRQSNRLAAYAAALDRLRALGVIYPCACTRREIQNEVAAMVAAPQGPEGPLYPGTCRNLAGGALSDRNTGILPVREDSASRLSADETPGWKPVVHDRQDAYLPLAQAWFELLRQPDKLREMAAASRRAAEQFYAVSVMRDGFLELARQVLASGAGTLPAAALSGQDMPKHSFKTIEPQVAADER